MWVGVFIFKFLITLSVGMLLSLTLRTRKAAIEARV